MIFGSQVRLRFQLLTSLSELLVPVKEPPGPNSSSHLQAPLAAEMAKVTASWEMMIRGVSHLRSHPSTQCISDYWVPGTGILR